MDVAYNLFMNSAAKILNKQGPFTPEELQPRRKEIISLIAGANHPVDIKDKAFRYLLKGASARQRIKRFLGNKKFLSQPGTQDKAMFEREKLAAEYFQKISNFFGPAIYSLSTSNNMVQRQNIVDGLKLNINTELKNYLAKTQPGVVTPLSEPGYGYDDMIAEFQKRIDDIELKYLGIQKENTSTEKQQPQVSGYVKIPKLLGLSSQDADGLALQNNFILKITQVKSNQPINSVVSQDPSEGAIKSKGTVVNIGVSAGMK
jgi:hypothetical protein